MCFLAALINWCDKLEWDNYFFSRSNLLHQFSGAAKKNKPLVSRLQRALSGGASSAPPWRAVYTRVFQLSSRRRRSRSACRVIRGRLRRKTLQLLFGQWVRGIILVRLYLFLSLSPSLSLSRSLPSVCQNSVKLRPNLRCIIVTYQNHVTKKAKKIT